MNRPAEESSESRKSIDEHPVDADGAWSTSAARYGVFYRLRITTKAGGSWYADDRPFGGPGSRPATCASPRAFRARSSSAKTLRGA